MRVRQGARKVLVCLISTRLSVHGFTCVVVADDEEREGGLVLQAAVLRPALDQDVSSASQEDQRERIVQEIERRSGRLHHDAHVQCWLLVDLIQNNNNGNASTVALILR